MEKPIWWDWLDLNQRPNDYESSALTTELQSLGGRERTRTSETSSMSRKRSNQLSYTPKTYNSYYFKEINQSII